MSPGNSEARKPAHLAYRPDIDGLRAVAVLVVVFYHAGLGCPGGFVGVDVFFVISGYLITALLMRDIRAGTFSFVTFWERRTRRIFPACAAVILVTLAAGLFLPLTADFVKLAKSALAQAAMAANFYFWPSDRYFAEGSFKPLLHMWSLAVEEQFYIFFPFGLWMLYRFRQAQRQIKLVWWLLAATLASLVLATLGVHRGHERSDFILSATFYLLPTRAWELLIGAVLAALPAACMASPRWVREVAAWAGLAGVLLPVHRYYGGMAFPGLAALLPCLGAAAIIWANTPNGASADWKLTIPGRLLALRPLVFIGLISYSLYLWHWPVLVFGNYGARDGTAASAGEAWIQVAVSMVLAVLSWRWIETPFRTKRIAGTRRGIFRLAGVATALLVMIAGAVVVSDGFPSRMDQHGRLNNAALGDKGFNEDLRAADVLEGRIPRFGVPDASLPPRILLWGDSHAMHAVGALDSFCREHGIVAEMIAQNATPPVMGASFGISKTYNYDGLAWADTAIGHIKSSGIKDVILAARWNIYTETPAEEDLLETSLQDTILHLSRMGCRVWVLQDVPDFRAVVPRLIGGSQGRFSWGPRGEWRQTRERHLRENRVLERLAARNLPATFLDPAQDLLEPDGIHYRATQDGVSLYFDGNHLTTRGTRLVLLPLLREKMGRAFSGDAAGPD
ncbi:acyltransferase family protein [Luteolibacter sp. SL250]|uniref:acyltransferase family protein n=1 Tax=Luteolibacter sp. SL250 TaxID=2995170 RepID=UPI002271EBA8|nr:acyltransferase family protein [Luteolibacter sp. SL250]WAC19653.1 acyltransferase family protein [Luteolibacter sp. SL250]